MVNETIEMKKHGKKPHAKEPFYYQFEQEVKHHLKTKPGRDEKHNYWRQMTE